MSDRQPAYDFDLFGSVTRAESDASWVEPREQCPVAWSDRHGGFWLITGYDEVAAAFRDWEHFSSARTDPEVSSIVLGQSRLPLLTPEEIDPPDWYPVRRILSEMLAPRGAERLRPRAQHWTTHFVDQFIEAGECEFTHELSVPVPGAVTLEWLGFPEDDWRMITDAFHNVAAYSRGTPEHSAAQAEFGNVMVRIREEMALREHSPRDDAMSAITHHEIDGERIPRETAESIVFMTVGGGVDTTTALIGAALLHLSQVPADKQRLLDEPELLMTATEEFLRFYPPARTHARTVTEDFEFDGCPMRKGDRVLLSEISSGRDAERSPNADSFVIDRNPNRHLSFGVGIHRCVGSHLARIEFAEVITQILERLPDFEVDVDAVVEYPNWASVGGWAKLPATFTPGPRIATDVTLSPAVSTGPAEWEARGERRDARRPHDLHGGRARARGGARRAVARAARLPQLVVRLRSRARRPAAHPSRAAPRLPRLRLLGEAGPGLHARRTGRRRRWRSPRALGVERLALLSHDMGDTVGGELLARQLDGTWPVEVTPSGAHQRQHLHRHGAAEPGPAAAARAPRRADARGRRRSTPRRSRAAWRRRSARRRRCPTRSSLAQWELIDRAATVTGCSRASSATSRSADATRRATPARSSRHPSPLHVVWGVDDPIAVVAMTRPPR